MSNMIRARNAPRAYSEAFHKMRVWGLEEESRNGPVMTSREPVELEIMFPDERVLFDPIRNANPFFHLIEAIWMFAGSRDVRLLEPYNKRYRQYADPGTDIVHGGYGARWRSHFGVDQLVAVVSLLKRDPTTRRGVIGMWDPASDLEHHNDLPCNTQIMFRVVDDLLNMTVANRSNDLVWGMLGANVVHMTMLQELIAASLGMEMGIYRVYSHNLHVYRNLDNFEKIWSTMVCYDSYISGDAHPQPMLSRGDNLTKFLGDAEEFFHTGPQRVFACEWFYTVAERVRASWFYLKDKNYDRAFTIASMISAGDWRLACQQYIARAELRSHDVT